MDRIRERYEGAQSFLEVGCLFLSLCSIAEQVTQNDVDILGVLQYARKQGYIDENDDLTVEGQCKLLRDLTGAQWRREVLKDLPILVPDEMYTVEKWVNPRTGKTHFKRRPYDTLKNSLTVKEGARVAYYAYIKES